MSDLKGALVGMGNPLLDISAVVPKEFAEKYGLKMNNAILAEEAHLPLYQDMVDTFPVEYIAGGATQNAIRVAQWMMQTPGATSYFGGVGKDEFATKLEDAARKDGVNVVYMRTEQPTGKCAVLVNDGERSLVAQLGAAEHHKLEHLQDAANWPIIEAARFYYIAAFFITHSAGTILHVAKHSAEKGRCFCMNLAAPFIMQVPPFKAALLETLPYIDFLFGNESEAVTFAETEGWETRDVAEIALRIAAMPKASAHHTRTVVITQGGDPTVIARDGKSTLFPVIPLAKEQLVDTNGAGDAFVGGFLSQLVAGKGMDECCRGGNFAANVVIQRSGCTFPEKCAFA